MGVELLILIDILVYVDDKQDALFQHNVVYNLPGKNLIGFVTRTKIEFDYHQDATSQKSNKTDLLPLFKLSFVFETCAADVKVLTYWDFD